MEWKQGLSVSCKYWNNTWANNQYLSTATVNSQYWLKPPSTPLLWHYTVLAETQNIFLRLPNHAISQPVILKMKRGIDKFSFFFWKKLLIRCTVVFLSAQQLKWTFSAWRPKCWTTLNHLSAKALWCLALCGLKLKKTRAVTKCDFIPPLALWQKLAFCTQTHRRTDWQADSSIPPLPKHLCCRGITCSSKYIECHVR